MTFNKTTFGCGFAIGVLFSLGQPARAQTTPDPNAAAIAALQTYELPDQTASARLPADWHVVQTGVGFIQARGPQGEFALFGVMIPAQDASPTAISPTGLTQPYTTDPEQKFLESINWMRARNGKPQVQAQFYGSTPITAPPGFGTCTNILAIFNGALATETDFCSLPADSTGKYRNFFKAVGLPVQEAKQERTLMEAILASFRLNESAIKAAHNAPPPATGSVSSTISAENSLAAGALMMQEANAINAQTFAGMQGMDNSVNNSTMACCAAKRRFMPRGCSSRYSGSATEVSAIAACRRGSPHFNQIHNCNDERNADDGKENPIESLVHIHLNILLFDRSSRRRF